MAIYGWYNYSTSKITSSGNAGYGNNPISFSLQNNAVKIKQFTIFTEPLCEGGVLKFADQTHLINFLAALKARCKKENLSDLYDTLYNDCRGGVTPPLRGNYVSFACVEIDGSSQEQFARARRFKKIAAYIHKITHPKNTRMSVTPKGTAIQNLCAGINIANPVMIAAGIRKDKNNINVGPLINDAKKFARWIAPHKKQIARGELRVIWMYIDNLNTPNACLVPNTVKNIAYAKLRQAEIYAALQIENSPRVTADLREKIKTARDNKIDQYNLPEKMFAKLDFAAIPALASVPFEPARNFLLELYAIFQGVRQFPNPFSWARFIVGIPLIDLDIKQMMKIWNYGTDIERALLIGQLLSLFLGPKLMKTCSIKVRAKVAEISLRPLKNSKACLINPSPDGSLTLITEKGLIYKAAFSAKKGLRVRLCGLAPKAKRPQVKIADVKTSSARPQPQKIPSGQNLPARRPVSAQSRRGDPCGRPDQRAQDLHPAPTPATAMSTLARAGKRLTGRGALQRALAPVTRNINTVRAMINDAVKLMAGTGGLRPAYAGAGNIPAQTATPTQMMSKGRQNSKAADHLQAQCEQLLKDIQSPDFAQRYPVTARFCKISDEINGNERVTWSAYEVNQYETRKILLDIYSHEKFWNLEYKVPEFSANRWSKLLKEARATGFNKNYSVTADYFKRVSKYIKFTGRVSYSSVRLKAVLMELCEKEKLFNI